MRGAAGAIALSLWLGCSGGAPAGGLTNGAHLEQSLEIPAGETITIPPGARIVAGAGVNITVRGVLVVASSGAHVRIVASVPAPDATQAWAGIVVEAGGRLEADGLDLEGASTALMLSGGSARYDHGTISDAEVPFDLAAGARLDMDHAAVVGAGAASGVSGELHATYLDYETSALSGGIIMSSPTAVFDVADSTFHGMMAGGGDFIVSYSAALVRVAYSTITDAHCGFHFDDVARFEVDHVTVGATSPIGPGGRVVYGAMLYGSGAGPHVISNSNFMGIEHDLDQQNTQGPLTITNTYTTGLDAPDSWTWAPADVAKAPIADAKPR